MSELINFSVSLMEKSRAQIIANNHQKSKINKNELFNTFAEKINNFMRKKIKFNIMTAKNNLFRTEFLYNGGGGDDGYSDLL